METVDQIIFRYDVNARAFRAVASTLPAGDLASIGPHLTALADAPYRREDENTGPSLCFAQPPGLLDGHGMIIFRVPERHAGRLAAAAHVLVGKLTLGTALGLSAGWPGWHPTGASAELAPVELAPIELTDLNETAQIGFKQANAASRALRPDQELIGLVEALLRAGPNRLAVVGYSQDPVVLLTGARAILGTWVTSNWSFSTGEPAQRPGVRITFLLPGGRVTSNDHIDLRAFPPVSQYLGAAAVLVTAFRRSESRKAWEEETKAAGVTDLPSLLDWASRGAPGAEASRAVAVERSGWLQRQQGWQVELERFQAQQTQDAERAGRLRDDITTLQQDLRAAEAEREEALSMAAAHRRAIDALRREYENQISSWVAGRDGTDIAPAHPETSTIDAPVVSDTPGRLLLVVVFVLFAALVVLAALGELL